MIVEKRIEELKTRWNEGKLSKEELKEFYQLLDKVVREARERRSAYLKDKPEWFLIELLETRIKNNIFKFFKKYPIYMSHAVEESKKDRVPIEESSTFQEWFHSAQLITRTLILGDFTKRIDRRKEVEHYLNQFESSEEKIISLNRRSAKAKRDRLLGQEGPHKKKNYLNDLKKPENLKEAERQTREFDWDDPLSDLKDIKGPGFLIKDYAAIRASLEMTLSKGKGHDPDYSPPKLKKLLEHKEWVNISFQKWENGKYKHEFNSKNDFIKWVEEGIKMSLAELEEKIQSFPERDYNLVAYLFGSGKKPGMLWWRLVEIQRFRTDSSWAQTITCKQCNTVFKQERDRCPNCNTEIKQDKKILRQAKKKKKVPEHKLSISKDSKDPYDTTPLFLEEIFSNQESIFSQVDEPIEEKIDSNSHEKDRRSIIKKILTEKQFQVYKKVYIEESSARETAKVLGCTRENIYKHLRKIKKRITENKDQLCNILTLKD